MAEIRYFPKSPPPRPQYGVSHPISALAVALKDLHSEADPFTCVAGAMVMTDRLSDLGFEVVRVLDMPVNPANGG